MRTNLRLLLFALALEAGCIGGPEPLPPDEALRAASQEVARILAENKPGSTAQAPEPAQTAPDPSRVTFWFYSHPLMSKALLPPDAEDAFNRAHPGIKLSRQFIGDWSVAVQKLTVNLAAGDLPDVALVQRSWLARLAPSGRIEPLDTLLPAALVEDLREPSRKALSVDGRLYALPADGFCSVLFCNRDLLAAAPPRNWDELSRTARSATKKDAKFRPIGYLPFLETLWSTGGDVFDSSGKTGMLDSPEAKEALAYLLSLRDEGLSDPRALSDELGGFQLFSAGAVAMTVGSSAYLPRARELPFQVEVGPVPGKSGPCSLLSDNAVVVFRRYAKSRQAAIVQLLDYLTGPEVQGAAAAEAGSAPVRASVLGRARIPTGLDEAYRTARGTPLIPAWSEIDFTMQRYLSRAWEWRPTPPPR